MRQAIMMTLLVGVSAMIMQCSRQESIANLTGKTEVASLPDTTVYIFKPVPPKTVSDTFIVQTDTIRWIYDFPPFGPSSLSFIISGISQLDLDVETYLNGVTTTVPLVRNTTGEFIDTVQIAATPLPEVVLTQGSRLFVKNGENVIDSIQLVNPW